MSALSRPFESMSPRDRKLLAGLLSFFGLVFMGLLFFTLKGWVDSRSATLTQKTQKYELLLALQQEYADTLQKVKDGEATVAQHAAKSPSAFLEETASTVGISDALTVSKQGTETIEGVEQTRYKVILRRVTVKQAYAFLGNIETSGYPIRVDTADYTRQFVSGDILLNVTLETKTFAIEVAG